MNAARAGTVGLRIERYVRLLSREGTSGRPVRSSRNGHWPVTVPTSLALGRLAGTAPGTRRSGTSIRGECPARSGNKRLKNPLFRSARVARTVTTHLGRTMPSCEVRVSGTT